MKRLIPWSGGLVLLGIVVGGGFLALLDRRPLTPPMPSAKPRVALPPAVPAPTARQGPAVRAIVVGIDRYQDPAIPPCHGAVADARALAAWLTGPAGWPEADVLVLDDRGDRPTPSGLTADHLTPTRANLDRAVKDWLTPKLAPGDVALLLFAGQATTAGSRPVLLPLDARADRAEATGWSPSDALEPIAASGRNPVVYWLDTSPQGRGQATTANANANPQPDADPGTRWLQSLTRWPGASAWLAADGHLAAEATAVGQRGPFASSLLKALGDPARPRNLLGALDSLNHDPTLARQGFRAMGGLDPSLTLWSTEARRAGGRARQLVLQRGHALGVSTLAFTPDGERLLSGGGDSTLRVWRMADRSLLRTLSYHLVGVTAASLDPDGRFLASGDGAGRVRLWDLRDDVEIPLGPSLETGIDGLTFLPDGRHFATIERGGPIRLHEPKASAVPRVLVSEGRALAVSPTAGHVAVAVMDARGKVVLFDADGRTGKTLDGPGGAVTSRRLATNGHRVAVGDDAGRLDVWEAEAGTRLRRHDLGSPLNTLAFDPVGGILAGAGFTLHRLSPSGSDTPLTLPGTIDEVATSPDGRALAVRTTPGEVIAWRLEDSGAATPLTLAGLADAGPATSLAFAPGGRALVVGGQDGGLRTWNLPDGTPRPEIPPRRGQVVALDASADARWILQVTRDRVASVWDFREGRSVAVLPGQWSTGAISPDGSRVALVAHPSGSLTLRDRATGQPLAAQPPPLTDGRLGVVAFDPTGRLIAAATTDPTSDGPAAFAWDATTGALMHTLQGHDDPYPLVALSFTPDGRRLLTASEDGTARLWNLDGPKPTAARVLRALNPKTGRFVPLRSACLDPSQPDRVVAGTLDGRVLLWEPGNDRPTPLADDLPGEVRALAFTADGKFLAAAGGADKAVRLWDLSGPEPRRPRLEPAPNHAEIINSLLAWPTAGLLASASDDTTIRLWDPSRRTLLGTFSAEQGGPDWVAFTPDGLFDGSPGGERQVSWRTGDALVGLEQDYDRTHVFRLAESLRQGQTPELPAPPSAESPHLALEADRPANPADRLVTLTLRHAANPPPADLRLYQDGVPIRGDDDWKPLPGARALTTTVRLRGGANRFYALGSRPGARDGRSNAVDLLGPGLREEGRLHVLALGVSHYARDARSLQFADRDAEDLARHLHDHGVHVEGTASGVRIVLTNQDVTEPAVQAAFLQLRDAVDGHPEDTVVVILAGHTAILSRRFHLLLSQFPFPDDLANAVAPEGTTVPFATAVRNLGRLSALRRVVVVDACEAGAIHDDPAVLRTRAAIDDGAQRARTAYLLASRRGEPAGEVSALEHGMLTYVLLKGMGQPGLRPLPFTSILDEIPAADRNRDGVVSTDELSRYTDLTLPKLAESFPALALVRRSASTANATEIRPTANLDQSPKLESAGATFPLVTIPEGPEAGR